MIRPDTLAAPGPFGPSVECTAPAGEEPVHPVLMQYCGMYRNLDEKHVPPSCRVMTENEAGSCPGSTGNRTSSRYGLPVTGADRFLLMNLAGDNKGLPVVPAGIDESHHGNPDGGFSGKFCELDWVRDMTGLSGEPGPSEDHSPVLHRAAPFTRERYGSLPLIGKTMKSGYPAPAHPPEGGEAV